MDSIFDALECLIDIITSFLYNKAFDKNKKMIKRLPYIIIYIVILTLIISLLTYFGTILINTNNILGYILLFFSLLCMLILIYPFIKNK